MDGIADTSALARIADGRYGETRLEQVIEQGVIGSASLGDQYAEGLQFTVFTVVVLQLHAAVFSNGDNAAVFDDADTWVAGQARIEHAAIDHFGRARELFCRRAAD